MLCPCSKSLPMLHACTTLLLGLLAYLLLLATRAASALVLLHRLFLPCPLLSPLTPAAVHLVTRPCPCSRAPPPLRPPASARVNLVLDPHKGIVVVLLALLLWLGWPWAAPPPPLLSAEAHLLRA